MEFEQEYIQEGENEQEIAEPVEDMTTEQEEEYTSEEQTEEEQTEEQPIAEPQSKEENAHFAQMRRQEELRQAQQQAYQRAAQDIEDRQYRDWASEQGIQGINSKRDYEVWEESQRQNVPYELMQRVTQMEQSLRQTTEEKQRLEYESTINNQDQQLRSDGDYGDLFKAHEQDIRQIAYGANVDLNTALAVFLMQDQGRAYFRQLKEQTKKEAQTETIRNITSNQSTPGALSTEKAGLKGGISNMTDKDFDKLYEAAKRGEIAEF